MCGVETSATDGYVLHLESAPVSSRNRDRHTCRATLNHESER